MLQRYIICFKVTVKSIKKCFKVTAKLPLFCFKVGVKLKSKPKKNAKKTQYSITAIEPIEY